MKEEKSLSDIEVLRRSEGEPWMFGVLVDRYQTAFLRRGNQILGSPDLAEDAVQETFIRIYKYAHKFSERENAKFSSWAYKILTNTCYTHATKRSHTISQVENLMFEDLDASSSTEILADKEQVSLAHSILNRLPEKMSRLLSLYFLEDKSYEEIADIEGVSLSAVRSGLHRARKQFKNTALKMTC